MLHTFVENSHCERFNVSKWKSPSLESFGMPDQPHSLAQDRRAVASVFSLQQETSPMASMNLNGHLKKPPTTENGLCSMLLVRCGDGMIL